jgi:DNA polymerase-3 subunit delta
MKTATTIRPLYFLYGPEDYLLEEKVRNLIDQVLPVNRGLNLHQFNGEEQGIQEVLQAARTLPMLSKYRLVLVNRADAMGEENVRPFLEYLQNPSPSTCLVLRGQEPGPWKKHLAAMEKVGEVTECPRIKGRGLLSWVRKRMAAKGKELSEEAADYLVEVIGDHLQDLDQALEKVYLSHPEAKTLSLAEVEGLVSDVKVSTVFDLTDAIGQQNLERAIGILRKVLESKNLPFRKEETSKLDDPTPLLLSWMGRQYRSLWRVKEKMKEGQSPEETAKTLRMAPWNVRKLMDQARTFDESSLREGLLKCQKTDLALKKGRGPKALLLEKLVIDLCRPDQKKRRMKKG